MEILFSILVVALNPGEKLKKTIDSILMQKYRNVEIIVKDGMSGDGSVEALAAMYGTEERLRIVHTPDRGIYDAMNQAAALAQGNYILFLNCGDTFYEDQVLARTAKAMKAQEADAAGAGEGLGETCRIYYGNTFCEKTKDMVHSAPVITGFTCYRNIPCHQSCFYDRRLFVEKQYDLRYKIRADYDHFLWCFYRAGAQMHYLDMTVSSYEGGGYSESRENKARDREEHKLITAEYMSRRELLYYRALMALTLAPLRRALAESRFFSGIYHRAKDWLYRLGR